MCFCVFFGRKEKSSEFVQVESRTQERLFFFFFGMEVPGAFYSPDMDYKATTL